MYKNKCMLLVAMDPTLLHTDQGVIYAAICNQTSFAYAARTCPTEILIACEPPPSTDSALHRCLRKTAANTKLPLTITCCVRALMERNVPELPHYGNFKRCCISMIPACWMSRNGSCGKHSFTAFQRCHIWHRNPLATSFQCLDFTWTYFSYVLTHLCRPITNRGVVEIPVVDVRCIICDSFTSLLQACSMGLSWSWS